MDALTPVSPNPNPPVSPGLLYKIRNSSKRTRIFVGAVISLLVIAFVSIFLLQNRDTSDEIIATVGGTPIPRTYLDIELNYYPATPSVEIKKAITDKVVNDQITLAEGKKEGYIADYPQGKDLSKERYLERIKLVEEVKEKVNASGNMIKGKLVSVWFYNNAYIGPKGLAAGKQISYDKIKPLYDQVQNGTMTIEQAGEVIASDSSLAEIDLAYKGNAIVNFTFYKDGTATFWPEFNQMLWNTEPGQLTPLYLGGGILRNGQPSEELYIFGRIEEKSTSDKFINYDQWLEKKKQSYDVVIANRDSSVIRALIKQSYAQGDNGSNQNDSQDSSNNGEANVMRAGSWSGKVKTETGVGIRGADAYIITSCTGPAGIHMTTDGEGRFSTGVSTNLACVCAPHTISATVQSLVCDKHTFTSVGNPVADIHQDIICRNPPPPPPPPACNVACTSNEFCASAPDGCTSCIGGTCQKCEPKEAETRTLACPPGQTGSITETRTWSCPAAAWSSWTATSNTCTPPPACGDNCTSDSYCFGAPDGCTSCVPNNAGTGKVCAKPPVCGSSCVRDDQCIGDAARDGCTACVDGTCRIPPACGTACTSKAECSGAKDGCTECLEGSCTDYNTNMCKCDGIVAELDYPNNFRFEAYGKVEGADRAKAEIADITFRLTQDNQVVAKSNPITPTKSEEGDKIRFKAAWQTPPPPVNKNSTYRVFADVRCKPKRITSADASKPVVPIGQTQEPASSLPAPKGLIFLTDLINKAFGGNGEVKAFTGKVLAQMSSPSPSSQTGSNLQLKTLNFVKLMDTDNCRFVMFKFDESLF